MRTTIIIVLLILGAVALAAVIENFSRAPKTTAPERIAQQIYTPPVTPYKGDPGMVDQPEQNPKIPQPKVDSDKYPTPIVKPNQTQGK